MASVIVHHLNNSRSQRILFLLEELKTPYTIKHYTRTAAGVAPPELEQVHPLGKSPVVEDGPHKLAESGAIVEYLLDKYDPASRFRPTDAGDKLQYTFWLHFAEGSLMTPLLLSLVFGRLRSNVPWLIRPIIGAVADRVDALLIAPNLKKHFTYIESHLEKNDFFAGKEFSGADVMMVFGVEAGERRAAEWVGPKTREWLKKIHARPTWAAALEKGGPYEIL
ncbi:glutathione S-transferase domain-containing protein [Zopfochytrium polystomum]|nr:glutathione S-transferase domain-containing protein [Zopfochytrium polystomum]